MQPNPRLSVEIHLRDCDGVSFRVWRGPVVNVKDNHKMRAIEESLSVAMTIHEKNETTGTHRD